MYKIIGADDREYGPISLEQLRQWQAQGRVDGQTKVLVVGETNWKRLAELTELSARATPLTPQPIQPLPGTVAAGPQRTNGYAIAGMVLGIISLFSFCCCVGLPFNLLGLIFSIVALMQINSQPETYSGKGLAIAGLITSGLSMVLGIGFQLLAVAFDWENIAREF